MSRKRRSAKPAILCLAGRSSRLYECLKRWVGEPTTQTVPLAFPCFPDNLLGSLELENMMHTCRRAKRCTTFARFVIICRCFLHLGRTTDNQTTCSGRLQTVKAPIRLYTLARLLSTMNRLNSFIISLTYGGFAICLTGVV